MVLGSKLRASFCPCRW